MNVYMTRMPGVPDRLNDVKPGMAWYCGTGPRGKTCGDCMFCTYPRRVQVLAASNRCWVLRYELRGRARWMGLGSAELSINLRCRTRSCRHSCASFVRSRSWLRARWNS